MIGADDDVLLIATSSLASLQTVKGSTVILKTRLQFRTYISKIAKRSRLRILRDFAKYLYEKRLHAVINKN